MVPGAVRPAVRREQCGALDCATADQRSRGMQKETLELVAGFPGARKDAGPAQVEALCASMAA